MITNNAQGENFTDITTNPFPGLRSFGVEESHLFFGREGQSELILQYLAMNRFAAVTGASGSGKSSLIYCGLIPILYGGFIAGAGSKWRIIATRPGNKPVSNLADALVDSESKQMGNIFADKRRNLVYSLLRRSSYGLVDAVSQMGLAKGENLLLILDQFEELFRFKESRLNSNTTINETEAFIKLFVNAVNQSKQPIYVVLTMRSDFIGDCSDYQELTKLINKSNYLIPQMTRQDFRNAIVGPITVAGAQIDSQLLQHVLNTIGDKTDQLPILQHAMMRTWECWKKYSEPGSSIRLRDYEAAGKLENALSMHANEAFEELSDSNKELCKSMFRTLTEKGADNKGIRRPATVLEIAEISQTSVTEVKDVVDIFRVKGRSFLSPAETISLEANTVIDISHESLMRVWDKLKNWVDEETASVQMYLRLSEASNMYQLGKTGLWRPPDLQLALTWQKTQKPSLAWAKRYNPAFEKVMVFLNASERKFQQEEQNKVKLQQRTLNRTRRFAAIMGVFSIAFLIMAYFMFLQYKDNKVLRVKAEAYAQLMEVEKDSAVSETLLKELERLKALQEKDSIDKARMVEILAKERETQAAYTIVDEVTKQSDSLQRTSEQFQYNAQVAAQTAEEARKQQSLAEQAKEQEQRKRMLSIAQAMAVKSVQVQDPQLKVLMSYQSYTFNKEYQGQFNHPDIYNGLFNASMAIKGVDFNAYAGHEGKVRDVVFVPGRNIFFSTGGDGKILRWDLYRNPQPVLMAKNNFLNRCLAISQDGQWLACGTSGTDIQIYNLRQPTAAPIIINAHEGGVYQVEFVSGRNQIISTGGDRSVKVWNLLNYKGEVLTNANSRVRDIALSPDMKTLYGALDNGDIVSWNLSNGEKKVLYTNNESNLVIAVNATGTQIAVGDKGGNLILINTDGSQRVQKKAIHASRVVAIDYNPNGTQLATSSYDGTIRILNMQNINNRPVVIIVENSWVLAIKFSPDGKSLITSSDNKDMLYKWPSNTEVLASEMCSFATRNMTQNEWQTYVGFDIPYEKTCPDK